MNTYAIIQSGAVVNVTLWDGDTENWSPAAGQTAVALPAGSPVGIGYVYDGTKFTTPVAAAPIVTLAQAQSAQIAALTGAYIAAIAQPVTFTSAGGVSKTFQADPVAIGNLQAMLAAFGPSGKVPNGFYWVAVDNTQVPFTLADLQGLAAAMGAQGWAAFQHLQTLKAEVRAASDQAAVTAIIW